MYPTEQCRDGIHIGGRGPCVRFASGCNWSALACPAAAPRVTCKPSDCDLPIPSAWRCPDGTSIGRFTCVATDHGTCGATYRPCPFQAKPAPTPTPKPTPRPRRACPDPLPSDRELATWPIGQMCSPGGGPDPGDVRELKKLSDGTRIVQANGNCVRVRYRQCHSKCLPPDARIATPSGDVPIHELSIGSAIWTRTGDGQRVAARVEAMTSVEITATHHVARIVLADGRALTVSPEHPLADARVAQQLAVGDAYDGSFVVERELVPYTGLRTYDLVPSGATGVYWADGIPLRSTIR
jgi:hypothetical protein